MATVVTTPACTVYLKDGSVTLLYKGATLPAASDLREGELKRLRDGGFVASEEKAAEAKEPTAAERKAAEKAEAERVAAEKKAAEEQAAAKAGGSGQ